MFSKIIERSFLYYSLMHKYVLKVKLKQKNLLNKSKDFLNICSNSQTKLETFERN